MFVLAFVSCTMAGAAFGDTGFTTGTSFENRSTGTFDARRGDEAGGRGDLYWLPDSIVTGAEVKEYAAGEAYDYVAHGTERNPLFKGENEKFLGFDLDVPLERTVLPRDGGVTNVMVKTADYDGIYADTLVKFLPSAVGPELTAEDRIVIWMREATNSAERVVTNLVVCAGRYDGSFKKVVPSEYVITNDIQADVWCRLTIRTISDVTEYPTSGGESIAMQASGFTVYIDGKPVSAGGDYDIGTADGQPVRYQTLLAAESRVLIAEHRLFPSLAKAGTDRAVTLSRLAMSGQGALDDVLFTTQCPGHVVKENVFTLNWDAGVVGEDMLCIVSNATGVVTNHVRAAGANPRYADFAVGANETTQVTVTNVVYDYAHDFTNGFWTARNGCTVTNNVFYAYEGKNPIGTVASARKYIGLGTNGVAGCVGTFAEAKRALTNDVKTLVLETDLTVTNQPYVGPGVARDKGYFAISAGDELILDLNGHALKGGSLREPTINQSGGSLRIIDSDVEKRGRVVPPGAGTYSNIALKVYADIDVTPTNVIEAGVFDGAVVVTGKFVKAEFGGPTQHWPDCVIDGGSFTNVFGEAGGFYLEQFVTNATAYYGIGASNRWTIVTNGFVWCGKGADTRWGNPANWRGKAVPGEDDLAIFPRATTPWPVDFGVGVATRELWLDGDIAMAGTNVFTGVRVVSGEGRMVGTGLACFTNAVPGKLTGVAAGGEIRLGADWRGTVRISGVTTATSLGDLGSWGVAGSKVEFNGVRGYLGDRAGMTLPYELVLTDDGGTPAWKNETGYYGSTISFPRLTGSGTFDSPENLRNVQQTYRFADVSDFTGKFLMGGKRLVLGTAVAASGAAVGTVTFADGVRVRTGKDFGWTAASAYFGKTLYVSGETNDVLLTYTGAAPVVREVTVYRTGEDGAEATNWLAVIGQKVIVSDKKPVTAKLKLGVKTVYATEAGDEAKAGSTIDILPGSAVSIVGNDVMVNGAIVSSIAGYYSVTGDEDAGYSVVFNEQEVKPEVVDFAVTEGAGGIAEIVVRNARKGLWYGVETRASLSEDEWSKPETWVQAEEDGEIYLPAPKTGETGNFYRVIVTDQEG